VEIVDVLAQLFRKDIEVDKFTTVRGNCHIFPHQEARDLRVLLTKDHILNADAELAVLVETRLVTDAHALDKLDLACAADALRTLVHIEASSDTVSRPVLVVETGSPEVLSGKNIHVRSTDCAVSRPNDTFEIKRSHQNSSVALLLVRGGIPSEVGCSRDISGAVDVLTTGVKQVDFLVVERFSSVFLGFVVDNGAICSNGRNRIEARLDKLSGHLSVLFNLSGSSVLIETMVRFLELLLKESKVLHNSSAVSNVSCHHSCLLNWGLFGLDSFNEAVLTNGVRFDDTM
jgi:hypothetical protein